jgi:hypothetical protein
LIPNQFHPIGARIRSKLGRSADNAPPLALKTFWRPKPAGTD